ncbi:MAG TPA: FliI/YscN family ATPase [Acetobacteraceae bacterium]|nr:FliI/YscN family ATPase [Acetobacteraceae bacterium]
MRQTCLADRADVAGFAIRRIPAFRLEGAVSGLSGLSVEVTGLSGQVSVGDRLDLLARNGDAVPAEIVGFSRGAAQAMAFGPLDGLGPGSLARASVRLAGPLPSIAQGGATLAVADGWLGRVIDPLGRPLDGRGPLPAGVPRPVRAPAPAAALRARLGPRLGLGVRSLDCFATCREGQRLGLFAGSGIGKSTLLGMLARQAGCDVVVLALVGERGREVREFMEDELKEGLARAVVVVATSDTPPLLRREAAYAAMTVAEHFRDQGASVLLLMDSVTRFCLALREIGLSVGEPPATRGFPPSVFAELPRLLERAGPGLDDAARPVGAITGLFTVLVEGDDHNEPVADAVRGILDGHVILDRRIAEAGRYPAVDVLRSLSRAAHGVLSAEEAALIRRTRAILALHADMADLVRLGAYRSGADPAVDEAVLLAPRIEAVLRQDRAEASTAAEAFARLAEAVNSHAA